jgi:hypothetical protein
VPFLVCTFALMDISGLLERIKAERLEDSFPCGACAGVGVAATATTAIQTEA